MKRKLNILVWISIALALLMMGVAVQLMLSDNYISSFVACVVGIAFVYGADKMDKKQKLL